eukprot:s7290_g2.t1
MLFNLVVLGQTARRSKRCVLSLHVMQQPPVWAHRSAQDHGRGMVAGHVAHASSRPVLLSSSYRSPPMAAKVLAGAKQPLAAQSARPQQRLGSTECAACSQSQIEKRKGCSLQKLANAHAARRNLHLGREATEDPKGAQSPSAASAATAPCGVRSGQHSPRSPQCFTVPPPGDAAAGLGTGLSKARKAEMPLDLTSSAASSNQRVPEPWRAKERSNSACVKLQVLSPEF